MKRKLISYDAFESINKNSLSAAEPELVEAAPILSNALKTEDIELLSFGPQTAIYECADGSYIHAGYKFENNKIKFENIEQLAIDTDTEKTKAREELSLLVDALIESNNEKANAHFGTYMSMPLVKRTLKEGFDPAVQISTGKGKKSKFLGKSRAGGKAAALKAGRTRKLNDKREGVSGKKKRKEALKKAHNKLGRPNITGKGKRNIRVTLRRTAGKKIAEWTNLYENVYDYIDFRQYGPIIKESTINTDDQGEISNIEIPTLQSRNEAKLLSFNWKTLATDVKVLRKGAKVVSEDQGFCKAVADLKRHNAMSDQQALEEALENIVAQWPGILYLTQSELAEQIKSALEVVKAENYDDQTCEFMAEGILRTAHSAYVDRVNKILSLAGVKECQDCKDKYPQFKETVDTYFPTLDESASHEMQVYYDLYNALREVWDAAKQDDDDVVKAETANHLNELLAIIENQEEPSLEVAEAAAVWLNYIMESNLETQTWNPSNDTHITTSGDHPAMNAKAKQGYSPAADALGGYSGLEISDGKKMGGTEDGFGNISGKDIFPDLENPYLLKAGDYTGKEKGVDKDQGDLATPKGSDTWPELKNPFCLPSESPKMNHGKDADLVVEK